MCDLCRLTHMCVKNIHAYMGYQDAVVGAHNLDLDENAYSRY